MINRYLYAKQVIQEQACTPLPLPQCFLKRQIFTKSFQCSQLLSWHLAKTLQVLTRDIVILGGYWMTSYSQKNCELGEGFVKICVAKKVCAGEGRECTEACTRWRDWDLGKGTNKQFEKRKSLWKTLKFSDCCKSIGKQIRPSELFLCLFGFMKATKFRDSSKFLDCVQNVWAKSCLPCHCFM